MPYTAGKSKTGIAAFTDANLALSAANFTASIAWGDGTSSSGTVTAAGAGAYSVAASHQYASAGSWLGGLTIQQTDGWTGWGSYAATVNNAPISVSAASGTFSAGVSQSGTLTTFTDGNTTLTAADFSANITWGDGTSSWGTVTALGGGAYAVAGPHRYASAGTDLGHATVYDDHGGTAAASYTATVNNAPITGTAANGVYAVGQSFSQQVATFTDANTGLTAADFTANISWGDGTSTTATVTALGGGTYGVAASHAYATAGTFTGSVQIQDDCGTSFTASYAATAVPVVSVSASGDCFEDNRQPTYFTLTANTPFPNATTVYFSLGGTATPSLLPTSSYANGIATDGTGYTVDGAIAPAYVGGLWSTNVAAGSEAAMIEVIPLNDSIVEDRQSVITTVSAVQNIYAAAAGNGAATTQVMRHDLVATFQVTTPSAPADVTNANNLVNQLGDADANVRTAAAAQLTQLIQQHPDLTAGLQQTAADPTGDPEVNRSLKRILAQTADYFAMVNALPNVTAASNKLTVNIPATNFPFDHITVSIVPALIDGAEAFSAAPFDGTAGSNIGAQNSANILFTPLKSGTVMIQLVVKWWDANGDLLQRTERDITATFVAN